MAAGLSRLMDDDQLRIKMAFAAREKAGHYSMEQIGKKWHELFADLALPRQRRRGPFRHARGPPRNVGTTVDPRQRTAARSRSRVGTVVSGSRRRSALGV